MNQTLRSEQSSAILAVKQKIARMGQHYNPGNVSKIGHTYSPLPFDEFTEIPNQRDACYERWDLIKNSLPANLPLNKTLIDFGCHTGFNCYMAQRLGFRCTGIEGDPLTTEIAQDISEIYGLEIDFHNALVTPDLVRATGYHDVCLFLSLFQWISLANGFDKACETLATAIFHCHTLFFETSMGNEGKAKMPQLPDHHHVFIMLTKIVGEYYDVINLGPVAAPPTVADRNDLSRQQRFIFKVTRRMQQ